MNRLQSQLSLGALLVASVCLSGCGAGSLGPNDNENSSDGKNGDGNSTDGNNENSLITVDSEEKSLSDCVGVSCPSGSRRGLVATCESSNVGSRLLRRLQKDELQNTLEDIFPEVVADWKGVELTQDPVSVIGFSTDAKVLVVNGPTFKNMLDTAESLSALVAAKANLEKALPCSVGTADASCTEEFINRYGLRLFRRPLSQGEVQRYVELQGSISAKSDYPTGIRWMLSAMLQSPHAFYRSEIGDLKSGGKDLTQYEVATNLAYTYSGTTPSPELLEKAKAGELKGAESLQALANQLLDEPENRASIFKFFREWLGYARIINQSRATLESFASEISPLLVEETDIFLSDQMFDGGTIQSMMLSDSTRLNGALAKFYGYGDENAQAEFVTTKRPVDKGVGILAQASLLASTAHQDETSPTLRGLRFMESFLCVDRPKPPAKVPSLAEAKGVETAKTTRQKYELHHGVGECASCHRVFDPYGFTFEQFDETGRYRADEDGEPLDTVATVNIPGADSVELSGLEETAQLVDKYDVIENCLTGLMSTYMLSGGGGQNCLSEKSRALAVSGDITLREFAVSLAGSTHFSGRSK